VNRARTVFIVDVDLNVKLGQPVPTLSGGMKPSVSNWLVIWLKPANRPAAARQQQALSQNAGPRARCLV
jgi:hypothetical protein